MNFQQIHHQCLKTIEFSLCWSWWKLTYSFFYMYSMVKLNLNFNFFLDIHVRQTKHYNSICLRVCWIKFHFIVHLRILMNALFVFKHLHNKGWTVSLDHQLISSLFFWISQSWYKHSNESRWTHARIIGNRT